MEYILMNEEYPSIEWNDQFLYEYTVFCESSDDITEPAEEAVPGLYEQWLKNHDYDPKTNTIMAKQQVIGQGLPLRVAMDRMDEPTYDRKNNTVNRRVNVGKLGSSKERNRLNKFLKENDFDPKTGTYRSDIKLPNGQYARIPLNIHVVPDEGKHISGAFATNDFFTDNTEKRIERYKRHDNAYIKTKNQDIADYENKLENETDPEMKAAYRDRISKLKNDIDETTKKSYNKKDIENDVIKDHLKTISTNMPKRDLMRKPAYSNSTLKHEEGHHDVELNIGHGNVDYDRDPYSYRVNFPNFDHDISQKTEERPSPGDESKSLFYALNKHDRDREEQFADKYSAHNNKYNKSKDQAIQNLINNLDIKNHENDSKKIKKEIKRVNSAIKALNYYKDNRNKIQNKDERDTNYEAKQFKKLNGVLSNRLIDKIKEGRVTPEDADDFIEQLNDAKNRVNKNRKTTSESLKARGEVLKAHLKDSDFKQSGDPSRAPKTNKQRAQERKERGDLTRKQKKQAKKQNVVKEYMI